MPVPTMFDGLVKHTKRVSATGLIAFENNRYGVPASFANRAISLRVYAAKRGMADVLALALLHNQQLVERAVAKALHREH